MSTPVEKDSERPSHQRGSSECKPLIDAATKDLFRKNAFRITGLPVDASRTEIARRENELTLRAGLGQDAHTQTAAFPIKPPPSLDEIREAFRNLRDPEKRLIDEFFWFWPAEFGKSQSDPAIRALLIGDLETASQIWSAKEEQPTGGVVAKHNLALVFHIAALDWENYAVQNEVEADRRQKITDYWQGAFNRWKRLATDETFWEKVAARIRQSDEPSLTTGFARRMRATLPEALDKINAELAVAFAKSGKIELARLHIQFMRESNQGFDNVEKTAELVLTPARNRLKEQIQRARDSAQQNPATAHEATRILIGHARPLLDLFDLFFGEQGHLQKELFDDAATTAVNCLVAYQKKTGDNDTFVKLLEETLLIAESIEVRRRIEKNIDIGRGNLTAKNLDSLYALLKAIQDSEGYPRARLDRFTAVAEAALNDAAAGMAYGSGERSQLFDSAAIVLRGISLDAWNKSQDAATALAANDLAIKYACQPDLKQRLLVDRATVAKNAEQQLMQQLSNKPRIGCLVVVAIFIVLGVAGAYNSTNTSPSSASYTPPAPSAPAYTPPPTFGSGNSAGNVYRVPRSVSSTLNSAKVEIETDRATLGTLETQIAQLGREIESDRIYLDRTSQFAVDEFNAKVRRYNALAQNGKTANAAFNEKVDNYNAKLQQYGR